MKRFLGFFKKNSSSRNPNSPGTPRLSKSAREEMLNFNYLKEVSKFLINNDPEQINTYSTLYFLLDPENPEIHKKFMDFCQKISVMESVLFLAACKEIELCKKYIDIFKICIVIYFEFIDIDGQSKTPINIDADTKEDIKTILRIDDTTDRNSFSKITGGLHARLYSKRTKNRLIHVYDKAIDQITMILASNSVIPFIKQTHQIGLDTAIVEGSSRKARRDSDRSNSNRSNNNCYSSNLQSDRSESDQNKSTKSITDSKTSLSDKKSSKSLESKSSRESDSNRSDRNKSVSFNDINTDINTDIILFRNDKFVDDKQMDNNNKYDDDIQVDDTYQ